MDDVWKVTRKDWVGLRDLLRDVSKGSKVIVTSRYKETAEIMSTVPPFDLANLSCEKSLTLFMECAFDQGRGKNHLDLMVIGKEIVSKCRRNPMAVTTLGSLLYSKNNRSDWEYVTDSEMWQLSTDILSSPRISYDQLPPYLKQCFAYCSIFPKNYQFNNFQVIELWVSNGFIQSSGNNQELEEIGQQYLDKLRSKSFFHVVGEDYPFVTFQMHDHELSVAQTESSNMKVHAQDISSTTRHILFPNPSRLPKDELRGCLSKLSHVRTIMFEDGSAGESFLKACISRFKRLQVLQLHGSHFNQLPSFVGGLKHLTYLHSCFDRNIKKLPKSVCKLRNLQYLGPVSCTELEKLPANIKNMMSLCVMEITTKQQRFPESGIGCLTSLRWLFIANCNNLEALFNDIQSLTSLRKLFIVRCPKLASLPQGIKNLDALEDLWIVNCKSLRLPEGESNEPRSILRLQSFVIEDSPEIVSLPGWLEGSTTTLQRIRIEKCLNLSVLPKWLQNCSSLRTLEIEDCPGLSSLPDGARLIPTLTKLRIVDCGKSSSCGEEDN